MNNTKHLKGKTAIITGASGGIGKALCCRLAEYGMNLVLAGRNPEKLEAAREQALESAAAAGVETACLICSGDLTDTGFEDTLVRSCAEHFGGIDVLINCAGIAQHDAFEDVTPEQFDRIMAANVRAPYFLCQKVLPYLRRSDMATIINICSVVAHKGYPQQSV